MRQSMCGGASAGSTTIAVPATGANAAGGTVRVDSQRPPSLALCVREHAALATAFF